jgi:hypothetical protein
MTRPILIVAALAALAVAGCDPDEQGRPLSFTGSYAGREKPPLSPDTLQALAARTQHQRGLAPSAQARAPGLRPAAGGSPWGAGASVRVGNGT